MSSSNRSAARSVRPRRGRLDLITAAVGGVFSGAARAAVAWLLNHITDPHEGAVPVLEDSDEAGSADIDGKAQHTDMDR